MKRIQAVLLTIIMAVAIFPLSTAAAEDAQMKSEAPQISNAATISTAADLEEAIQNAADGDTILIDQDIVFIRTINLDKSLTLASTSDHPITLYVSGAFRHFSVYVNRDITVNLENIVLDGRVSDHEDNDPVGGGLNADSALSLSGGSIQYCTAIEGGGIKATADLSINGTTIQHCVSTGNSDYTYGGAAVNVKNADLTLRDVNFSFNYAAGCGGAVHASSLRNNPEKPVSVKVLGNCVFKENIADRTGLNGSGVGHPNGGGAIYTLHAVQMEIIANDNETILFEGNNAEKGGAIFCYGLGSANTLTLTANGGNIVFSENSTAKRNYYTYGGAIFTFDYSNGSVEATITAKENGNIVFADNVAQVAGGAIGQYASSAAGVSNTMRIKAETGGEIIFENNSTYNPIYGSRGHGGALFATARGTETALDGSGGTIRFDGNSAGGNGGAISVADPIFMPGEFYGVTSSDQLQSLTVINVDFADNRAATGVAWSVEDDEDGSTVYQDLDALHRTQVVGGSYEPFGYAYNNHDVQFNGGKTAVFVTYYLNDGSDGVYLHTYHIAGTAITPPNDPVSGSETFRHWSASAEGGSEFDFTSEVSSDLKLYAQWGADCNLIYHSEYADEPYVVACYPGEVVRIREHMFDHPDNVVFLGWSDVEGAPANIDAGAAITMEEGDYHLYAVYWKLWR